MGGGQNHLYFFWVVFYYVLSSLHRATLKTCIEMLVSYESKSQLMHSPNLYAACKIFCIWCFPNDRLWPTVGGSQTQALWGIIWTLIPKLMLVLFQICAITEVPLLTRASGFFSWPTTRSSGLRIALRGFHKLLEATSSLLPRNRIGLWRILRPVVGC